MSTSEQGVSAQTFELPAVPLTLEGSAVLHQMFRFRWNQWRTSSAEDRARVTAEAQRFLVENEPAGSALFSMFGHKGDLLFVHFRETSGAQPGATRTQSARNHRIPGAGLVLRLGRRTRPVRVHRQALPHPERARPRAAFARVEPAIEETLDRQRKAMPSGSFRRCPRADTSASIPWTASAAS